VRKLVAKALPPDHPNYKPPPAAVDPVPEWPRSLPNPCQSEDKTYTSGRSPGVLLSGAKNGKEGLAIYTRIVRRNTAVLTSNPDSSTHSSSNGPTRKRKLESNSPTPLPSPKQPDREGVSSPMKNTNRRSPPIHRSHRIRPNPGSPASSDSENEAQNAHSPAKPKYIHIPPLPPSTAGSDSENEAQIVRSAHCTYPISANPGSPTITSESEAQTAPSPAHEQRFPICPIPESPPFHSKTEAQTTNIPARHTYHTIHPNPGSPASSDSDSDSDISASTLTY
jgi:hypothetical protein